MFRPPSDSDGVPCPVEFINSDSGSPTDNDGDRSRQRRSAVTGSRKTWAFAVATVLVIAAFVLGDRHERAGIAQPAVTAPIALPATLTTTASLTPTSATTSTAAAAVPARAIVPDVADVAAVPGVVSAAGTVAAAGRGVFLFNAGSRPSLVWLDLGSGAVRTIDDPPRLTANDRVVAMTAKSIDASPISARQLGNGGWALCADGTVWVATQGLHGGIVGLRRLRLHGGSTPVVVQTAAVTPIVEQMRVQSIGTTGDDRPVLTAANGRAYVLDPVSGELTQLSLGLTTAVQHGFYAETVCAGASSCSLVLHGKATELVLLKDTSASNVSFSPDGSHALVMRTNGLARWTADGYATDARLSMIDLRSGEVTDVAGSLAPVVVADLGGSAWALWSGDGTVAVYGVSTGLGVVDVRSAAFAMVVTPNAPVGSWMPVGMT